MKAGIRWLLRLHGARRARRVAEAYRHLEQGRPFGKVVLRLS